jgi:hypothetical protein
VNKQSQQSEFIAVTAANCIATQKQIVWPVDAARKRPMEVNIGYQSHSGTPGSRSIKQTDINSNPCLRRALQRFLIAGHLCHRSQITRPDLLNQQVSRQLLILPTTIHTQITTTQSINKGVVSFQLHFSEQLQSLKSAQQEGASSL